MANPKKKMSKARRNSRRTHDVLKVPALSTCGHCGQTKLPHRVCPECGYYDDRKIIEVEEGV